jgi:hypothetical protein
MRLPQIPHRTTAILKPKLSSEDLTNRVVQSESHKRCKVVLGIEQRRCWEDGQLLCERGDGVCCYTGWYVGTECNSDRTVVNSVTGQLLCERDDGVCCYTGWYVGTEQEAAFLTSWRVRDSASSQFHAQ